MQHTMQRLALVPAVGAALFLGAAFLSPAPFGPGNTPGVGEPGGPTRDLTPGEMQSWLAGRALFDRNFHIADGVGTPEMNADSCRACHQDPVLGGAGGLELNVSRFGYDNGGAGPFTNLPGGQAASKLRPPMVDSRENPDPTADVFEQRQTPTALGIGLIESIPDLEIYSNEDPMDLDGDLITGVARRIEIGGPGGLIEAGRFGWKAQVPTVVDFVKDAMAGECGITTPDDGRGFALLSDADSVADPELSHTEVKDLQFFLQLLGPPLRTGSTEPPVLQGEALFASIGCDKCHIPALMGSEGAVRLYSDLLLHNVMKPTYRGMSEPGAGVGEFRTPPLWGVSDTAPYLHDGRGEDLDQAIRMHFGEARRVKANYVNLNQVERDALIAFLEDL